MATATSKRPRGSSRRSSQKLNPHIQNFIDLVESGKLRASKEVHALIDHVKHCFETEAIYVNAEQADHYIGLAKYFPWERLFPWQEFVITLHDCTYYTDSDLPRWPDLFCMLGRGAGKDGTIALESVALISPYNGIPGYDVDVCANNEEQALRPVLDIVAAFEGSEYKKKLQKWFRWKTESVSSLKLGCAIRGRTNNPKGKDGMRSGMVIFNEVHQFENYNNIKVFITGQGKVAQPRSTISWRPLRASSSPVIRITACCRLSVASTIKPRSMIRETGRRRTRRSPISRPCSKRPRGSTESGKRAHSVSLRS